MSAKPPRFRLDLDDDDREQLAAWRCEARETGNQALRIAAALYRSVAALEQRLATEGHPQLQAVRGMLNQAHRVAWSNTIRGRAELAAIEAEAAHAPRDRGRHRRAKGGHLRLIQGGL